MKRVLQGHPPHGGCGLKLIKSPDKLIGFGSSPTRGMWIEIARTACNPGIGIVIPHTGDVD